MLVDVGFVYGSGHRQSAICLTNLVRLPLQSGHWQIFPKAHPQLIKN
jgi:hypothetical protein